MKLRERIDQHLFHYLGTIQEPWYTWLNALANAFLRLRHPERIAHRGERFPDKTFYLIRDISPNVGLASWYDLVLGYVLRAQRKGWIPVVEPAPPAQADDGDWYAFFNGPSEYRPADLAEAANVVVATQQGMIHKRYSKRNIARRHPLCEAIPLSAEAKRFVEQRMDGLLAGLTAPFIGVRYRGTDYRTSASYRPFGHAKVPSMDEFCFLLERDCARWGVPVGEGEHFLVVTEEQEALDDLRRRYPKCRFVEKERFSNFRLGDLLPLQRLPSVTPRENNFLYLLDILALARCDYLIGGINASVLMALTLNGNRYRAVDILNTGVN